MTATKPSSAESQTTQSQERRTAQPPTPAGQALHHEYINTAQAPGTSGRQYRAPESTATAPTTTGRQNQQQESTVTSPGYTMRGRQVQPQESSVSSPGTTTTQQQRQFQPQTVGQQTTNPYSTAQNQFAEQSIYVQAARQLRSGDVLRSRSRL